MKKTSLHRKLKLNKETIAALREDDMRVASGGQRSILPETWACSWWGCTNTCSQCG